MTNLPLSDDDLNFLRDLTDGLEDEETPVQGETFADYIQRVLGAISERPSGDLSDFDPSRFLRAGEVFRHISRENDPRMPDYVHSIEWPASGYSVPNPARLLRVVALGIKSLTECEAKSSREPEPCICPSIAMMVRILLMQIAALAAWLTMIHRGTDAASTQQVTPELLRAVATQAYGRTTQSNPTLLGLINTTRVCTRYLSLAANTLEEVQKRGQGGQSDAD